MTDLIKTTAPYVGTMAQASRGNEPAPRPVAQGLPAIFAQAGNHAAAAVLTTRGPVLQRKCACGGGGGSPCGCDEKESDLLRLRLQSKLVVNQPGDQMSRRRTGWRPR